MFLTERGVCRLHPQLARTVTGTVVDDSRVADVAAWIRRDLLAALPPSGLA